MQVAGLQNIHAASHVIRHNIAAGLVEDGLRNTRVGGTQGLPVTKDGIWS
jgi:hypothetical protein